MVSLEQLRQFKLRLAKEKRWMAIILESDCQDTIDRIIEEENYPCRTLIEDGITKDISPIIKYVLRETNRCVDKMTCLGKNQYEKLVKVLVPPMKLVDDLNVFSFSCLPKKKVFDKHAKK